ncbi:hypothetical protein AB832_07830 [Flavobacteriaceae bacterium (ex Bugula neritina AB1)]|nr:hypothetical protein AB832_07830 [Flavobacteriaceae bacterium (ex Bugula neritina AB1)]
MERLTKEKREILRKINVACRNSSRTHDIHEWHFFVSKSADILNNKESSKYFCMTSHISINKGQEKKGKRNLDYQNEWRNLF